MIGAASTATFNGDDSGDVDRHCSTSERDFLATSPRTENRSASTPKTPFDASCFSAGTGDPGGGGLTGEVGGCTWRRGYELPPFTVALTTFLNDIHTGAVEPSPVQLTDGVVVQLYYLVFVTRPTDLKVTTWRAYYTLLSCLAGSRCEVPSDSEISRLKMLLTRKSSPVGLYPQLQVAVKDRRSNPALRELTPDAAREKLFISWDAHPLVFTFAAGAPPPPPPPPPSGPPTSPRLNTSPPPLDLDIRTRTMDAQICLRAAASCRLCQHHGLPLTEWHELGGALPVDALIMIDRRVRLHAHARARREETHELQAIRLREQVDQLRKEVDALESVAHTHKREAARAQRQRDAVRADADAKVAAAADQVQEVIQEMEAALKDVRADAAAKYRALQKEMQSERVEQDERATRLQGNITELERQLNRAQATLRRGTKEAAEVQSHLEKELQHAQEGRVWARVTEEQARRERAEAARNEAQTEVERLKGELNTRSQKISGERQELSYLRYRVKELESKVQTYQARSNRKFFEVEPFAEENERIRQELEVQCAETAKYKAIAVPDKSYFHNKGFTLAVDLAIAEAITKAHVSRNQVPLLFIIFARFFRVTLPTHEWKVPHKKVDGKMTYVTRTLQYIPGKTHVKQVCATINQAHKLQIGVELLEHDASYCYIADGAESLQSEYLAQLLSRRDENGKLQVTALDLSLLHSKTSKAQQAAFTESLKMVAALCQEVGITEELSPRLLNFTPASTMNDRAAPARMAARLTRGGGKDDGIDDPTCTHHAITNIFEEGRKAKDGVLRNLMNITEEQAESVASKVKAMRTCVGWFSSPACSLIYQVSKYVALFSSKGYAVGAKFRKWIETEEHARLQECLEGERELLGAVEDMLAICGSRDYVFFMDAAVTERFAQVGSLLTFLKEEADMGAEAGGKLRSSILTGFGSEAIMAAVRSMALVCDSALWVLLRCIGSDLHILDVLPEMWPKTLAFFEAAAKSPKSIIDGSLRLELSCVREAKVTPRAKRAAIDMERIRVQAVQDSELVERMLSAAFSKMAEATRNHASEFLPGGICATDKITPELRERLSGCPMTSTGAERMFAVGRKHDERAGASRDDTRAGVVLGDVDNTAAWMRERPQGEAEWRVLRKRARMELRETMAAKRLKVGLAEREEREAKLAGKRAKRAAKAAERARLDALALATHYSELKEMNVDSLSDQLRKHKLLGKKGFTVTQSNRTAYVLQLQTLLLEADATANDLANGDSGVDGRSVKRKAPTAGGSCKKKGKKRAASTEYMGHYWTAEEEDDFEVEAIVGKLTADGKTKYANQGAAKKGTVLYRIVWKDYPPDVVWYEPAENVGKELLDEFEARAAAEAAQEEAEAREEAELDEMEEEVALPAV